MFFVATTQPLVGISTTVQRPEDTEDTRRKNCTESALDTMSKQKLFLQTKENKMQCFCLPMNISILFGKYFQTLKKFLGSQNGRRILVLSFAFSVHLVQNK